MRLCLREYCPNPHWEGEVNLLISVRTCGPNEIHAEDATRELIRGMFWDRPQAPRAMVVHDTTMSIEGGERVK